MEQPGVPRARRNPKSPLRYADAESAFAARDSAAHEADQRARREALTRLQQLVGRIEPVADARRPVAEGRRARAERHPHRARHHSAAAVEAATTTRSSAGLKAAQTALMPKVQELRDVADWQRWANVGIQEQLCEKMEALKSVEDPEEIAKQVRDLQQQWRQAADVPRAQGEALWRRFKAAHDEAWARCEAYFAAQNEARAENLAKKIALIERAEALAESTNWIQTADEIKKLQAEWKTIGPVSRGQEKAIWERFRAACDRVLHAPPRRSRRAQDDVGGEPGEEGRAVRQGRGARAIRPTGTPPPARSSGCRPSGKRSVR